MPPYKRDFIAALVPQEPEFVQASLLEFAFRMGMASMTGKDESALNSLMQKWPASEVTATASAPAEAKQFVSAANISAGGLADHVGEEMLHLGMDDC